MNQSAQLPAKIVHIVAALLLFGLFFSHHAVATPVSDAFIQGYATAVLQRDFQVTAESIRVEDGVIYLKGLQATDVVVDKMKTSLSAIEGVNQVVVSRGKEFGPLVQKPAIKPEVNVFFPRDLLFKSLLADPRWPHFSASYQRYFGNSPAEGVGSANFGETFSIYRFASPWESQMEVGLQAGVFSIFDLESESTNLVNADYFVAIPLSLKKNNFSALARVFHQSSHLGDEFILSGQAPQRINLSYEGVDAILSYNLPSGFRIYGGGGYLFDRDPSSLKPWIAQWGLEFRSPVAWWGGSLRPVAAIDLQNHEANDWDTSFSMRAGVQFENPNFMSRKLQLLLEYYNGNSPNGQFFLRDSVDYLGLGFHFFYD